ncbi:MAG: sel1 repeat family protein [Myxococcales bacterium]|nr:sel1 repeat family protein [Myxococcales bacterium]
MVALYFLFDLLGVPTFYDKLAPVPFLNLSIKWIDRAAASRALRWLDPARLGPRLAPRRRNLAYMTIWALAFAGISAVDGVGDAHPGNRLPFWQQACKEGRRGGCRNLATMAWTFCNDGSGWACNEIGMLLSERRVVVEATPAEGFARACRLGFKTGCDNAARLRTPAEALQRHAPRLIDYNLLLERKGHAEDHTPLQLFERACEQGWADGCFSAGIILDRGEFVPRNGTRAREYLLRACSHDVNEACAALLTRP